MKASTVELLDGRPRYHLQLIGGIQAPGPCTDLLGHQSRCPPTPDLLCRGSAPWRGGTVTICSRAKSSHLILCMHKIATAPVMSHRVTHLAMIRPNPARSYPTSPLRWLPFHLQ